MLNGYIGQADRLAALKVAIRAAQERHKPLPHMLLLGRSGLGKTTLARAIANEMDVPFTVMHAPNAIEREYVSQKIEEAEGGILFIDEIHALDRSICEDLYTVIDDGVVTEFMPVMVQEFEPTFVDKESDLPEGYDWDGPMIYDIPTMVESDEKTVVRRPLQPITIIGATTDEALLPQPFYRRLSGLKVYLREYTLTELATIAILYADDLDVTIDNEAAMYLAMRSLSNPARIKQLVDRASDRGDINDESAEETAESLGVDNLGLETPHRDILTALAQSSDGLSRTSLGQKLGLPPKNLDHYWTDLLRLNLVTIDTRHRITQLGRQHVS